MSKDDFKIRINEENELVVTLEHKDEKKEEKKDEKYLRREFSYSHFEQTLLLPDDIKKEEISASMEHGVLNITRADPASPGRHQERGNQCQHGARCAEHHAS